ncbi:MAG: haloacid dehalogenase type II [Marmoricola sp.]
MIVFDVNETLSDLSPVGARFFAVGASASAASAWFAGVLRDGFALTVAGARPSFAEVAREGLVAALSQTNLNRPLDEAVEHVLAGLGELPVHPDVVSGINALAERGHRLVTLSNGAASVAESLLERAGIRDRFDQLLSVEDARAWKPSPRAYEFAGYALGVPHQEMTLVAVHPWDIDGASREGLNTVWVNRTGGEYPGCFEKPAATVTGIDELPDLWPRA